MPIISSSVYYAGIKALVRKTFKPYTSNSKFYTATQGLGIWKKLRATAATYDASPDALDHVDKCFCKIIREFSENSGAGANTVLLNQLIHDLSCCIGDGVVETVVFTLITDGVCSTMTCIEDGVEFTAGVYGEFTSLTDFVAEVNANMANNYTSYVPYSATLSEDCTDILLQFDSSNHPSATDIEITITPQVVTPTIAGGTCPLNFTAGVRFNAVTYNSSGALTTAVQAYLVAQSFTVCACTYTTGTCVFNVTSLQLIDIPLLLTQL